MKIVVPVKLVPGELKAHGLGAQAAQHVINRPARDHFCCRRCGLAGPAGVVAGVNVRDRARSAWVCVNMPPPVPA